MTAQIKRWPVGPKTPQQVLLSALESAENLDLLVIGVRFKDGEISVGWSAGKLLERLGLCDVATSTMIEASDDNRY